MPPPQKLPGAHWLSRVQLDGQVTCEPLQRYGAQVLGVPIDTAEQVPCAPVMSQRAQADVQVELQQKPFTHWLFWHWVLAVQAVPTMNFETHSLLALQNAVLAQFASVEHVAGHDAAEPSQTYGEQVGVPELPGAAGVHAPNAPLMSHRSHAPEQAPLQQYPSTQLPDWHWLAPPHEIPLAFFPTHCEPLQ